MKYILIISILLFLSNSFFAQRDEAIRDTTIARKLFNVIMYNEANRVACVGNYMPNTFIRTGEWDYFYNDGKLYSKEFFKLDDKVGSWIYYDENGNLIKKEIYHNRIAVDLQPIIGYCNRSSRRNSVLSPNYIPPNVPRQIGTHVDFQPATYSKTICYDKYGNRIKPAHNGDNTQIIESVFYKGK